MAPLWQRLRRWRWVGRELGRLLGIFLLGSGLVFAAVHAMPEDPVALRVKNPDPARVAEIRAELGLEDPLWQQYGRYLVEFVRGDWGESLVSGRSVLGEVGRAFPATLEMGLLALVVGTGLGVALVLSSEGLGWRWLRWVSRSIGAMGLTLPIYWIGMLLTAAFAVGLGWLPVSGRFDFREIAPEGTGFLIVDALWAGDWRALGTAVRHRCLPVMTLALYPAALVAGTLEARLQDPRVAQLLVALEARGYGPVRIWGWHMLRLAGAPLVTVIGTNFGALLGGAVLTETVYSWPGMGQLLVRAVTARDVFLIQHGLLLVVTGAALAATVTDVIARQLDPAQRRKGAGR